MIELKNLPGTTVAFDRKKDAETILDGLFSVGGLVFSQLSALTGLEGYMIQNWVKRGFLTPPVGKKYTKNQFCRLITINLLKDSLSIPEIVGLLSYINGQLNDESDDMIDDSLLYIYFTRTLLLANEETVESARSAAFEVVKDFTESEPGCRERLVEVLCVMFIAYSSSMLRKTAKELVKNLPAAPLSRREESTF